MADTSKTSENGEKGRSSTGGIRKTTDNDLPMARVRKIMKMDPKIDNISNEANFLVCIATEQFLKYLAKEVYATDKKALSYENLAKYIANDEKLDFLAGVVPEKITVRQYKKILAQELQKENVDSGSDYESSSSDSEDEDDSESASESDNEKELKK